MRPISKSRLSRPTSPDDPITDRDPGDENVEPGPLLELPEPVWDYGIETMWPGPRFVYWETRDGRIVPPTPLGE